MHQLARLAQASAPPAEPALRLGWLTADGKKLLVTRRLRTLGYGYLAVVVALCLEQVGLSPAEAGLVLTAAGAGAAAMTVFWSLVADRVGRRRTVAVIALLRG